MGNIGGGEIVLLLVLALLIFGPQRLPEISRNVGKAIREFRRAASELTEDLRAEINDGGTQHGLNEPQRKEPRPGPRD